MKAPCNHEHFTKAYKRDKTEDSSLVSVVFDFASVSTDDLPARLPALREILNGVLHCHGFTSKYWEESVRAVVSKTAPRKCRARRVRTPKDKRETTLSWQ